jgi:predicted permease
MRNMATTLLPLSIGLSIDRRVLAFSVVLSVLTLMLFSLAPAMATARSSLDSILRGVRSSSSMRGRQALIVVQIALCTFLLAFAGLFVRTFQQLRGMDPGFDRDHVATFTVDLMGWTGFETKAEAALREALTTRVRQIPCVVSAATSARGVMRGRGLGNTIVPEGHSLKPGDFLNTSVNTVSPEYFDTMGMSILAGRGLTPRDVPADSLTSRASVVVNRAFAQRFFPGVDPVGKHFGPSTDTRRNEIVGVVSDAKYRSLREPIPPTFYSVVEWGYGSFVLNVRTRVRPESIFEPVRKALAATDPSVAFLEIHTLADEVDASTASERLTAALASIFGAIAALLVGVGIYGLLAYAVAQRKREIGIRMALGARLADIRGLIGRQVCLMVACGVAAGILGALMAGKWSIAARPSVFGPLSPVRGPCFRRGIRTAFASRDTRRPCEGLTRGQLNQGLLYTSSIVTRRPSIAAARCRLDSVMSFFGSSRRSTCVRLVFNSAAMRAFDIFCFLMASASCHATTSLTA